MLLSNSEKNAMSNEPRVKQRLANDAPSRRKPIKDFRGHSYSWRRAWLGWFILAVIFLFSAAGYVSIVAQVSRAPAEQLTPNVVGNAGDDGSHARIVGTSDELGTPEWRNAERKWELFAEEHMARMRRLDRQFDREWLEIKHPLISKYLSDYRIFTDKYFTFALYKSGRITAIGTTWPGNAPYKTAPDFETKEFSNFLKSFAIPVSSSAAAIELVRLKLIVDGGHGVPSAYDDGRDWQFGASKENSTWYVKVDYKGDPKTSIERPPKWEIKCDIQNIFQNMQETL